MSNTLSHKQQTQNNSIKQNNNINFKQIKIFIMIFATCVLAFPVFSAAGTWEDPKITDFWNPLAFVVYLAYNAVFSGGMFSGSFFGKNVFGNGIMGNLIFDTENSSMAAGVWGLIEGAYAVIQPVGITLVILYFLLSLIEKVQMDNFNVEHLIKNFIKLMLAILLIANGLELLSTGLDFTNAMYYAIQGAIGDPGGSGMGGLLETIYDNCKTMGILEALGTLVLIIPMILINLIAVLMIYIISFSRLFQIGIYGIFAPIGMANIYEGGLNSSGFRYFKKFLAVGLQGVIIFVITNIMNQISAALVNGGGNWNALAGGVTLIGLFTGGATILIPLVISLLVNIVICFTAIALMFKAMSFANDVIGV